MISVKDLDIPYHFLYKMFQNLLSKKLMKIWRPTSKSELAPYQIQSGLIHLGSEASI